MILPDKHITLSHSLIGSGARVLKLMDRPVTVSALWDAARGIQGLDSYWRFIIVLDFLYTVGAVDWRDGLLAKAAAENVGASR